MTLLAERPAPSAPPRGLVVIWPTPQGWTVYANDRPMLYYDRDCSTLADVRGLAQHMRRRGYTVEAPKTVFDLLGLPYIEPRDRSDDALARVRARR